MKVLPKTIPCSLPRHRLVPHVREEAFKSSRRENNHRGKADGVCQGDGFCFAEYCLRSTSYRVESRSSREY